jgi:3-oxoacyl-[acyl-carrier protein] reductase
MPDAPADRVALVTNVHEYAGPSAVSALSSMGMVVACHDERFVEEQARSAFAREHPGTDARGESEPAGLVEAVLRDHGRLDVVVSNDIAVPPRRPFDEVTVEEYREVLERLTVRPFAIAKAAVPHMAERGSGCLIFITSATAVRPVVATAPYGSARAATTNLAMSLAKELAGRGVQVNAIGPHWFSNPTYFPPGWDSDQRRREIFEREVPLRRLGREEEMGALIALLASGKVAPVTGQFIGFTSGWLP